MLTRSSQPPRLMARARMMKVVHGCPRAARATRRSIRGMKERPHLRSAKTPTATRTKSTARSPTTEPGVTDRAENGNLLWCYYISGHASCYGILVHLCAACGEETSDDPCTVCGALSSLEGEYLLLAVIGRGSFGVTYKARRIEDERIVAVKKVSMARLDSAKSLELLDREIAVMAQLEHPAVPRYIDHFSFGEHEASAMYLVQEYVEGATLEEAMTKRRFTDREVLELFVQVLGALQYLSGLRPQLVHRDLNPRNIILKGETARKGVALVDFGSVRDAVTPDDPGGSTVAGTFGYMAPEQLRGAPVPASDVYSLGVVGLVLLTRREPHTLYGEGGKLEFPALPDVHPLVVRLLERMVAPEVGNGRERRFTDPREARTEAMAAIRGLTKPASKSSLPVTISIALVLIGVMVSVWIYKTSPPEAPPGTPKVPPAQAAAPPGPARGIGAPTIIEFEARISDLVPGGGGRYLVAPYHDAAAIDIFDTESMTFSARIEVPTPAPKVAASREHLLVFHGVTVERWSIDTWKREQAKDAPCEPTAVAMGAASDGPALVHCYGERYLWLDVDTLEPTGSPIEARRNPTVHIRAALDGSLFGMWGDRSPQGIEVIERLGTRSVHLHRSGRYVFPTANGERVMTAFGAKSAELEPLTGPYAELPVLPAYEATHHLVLPGHYFESSTKRRTLDIHREGVAEPLAELQLREMYGDGRGNLETPDFTTDKRFHFYPSTGVLITVPPSSDRLYVRRVDLDTLPPPRRRAPPPPPPPPARQVAGAREFYTLKGGCGGDPAKYNVGGDLHETTFVAGRFRKKTVTDYACFAPESIVCVRMQLDRVARTIPGTQTGTMFLRDFLPIGGYSLRIAERPIHTQYVLSWKELSHTLRSCCCVIPPKGSVVRITEAEGGGVYRKYERVLKPGP